MRSNFPFGKVELYLSLLNGSKLGTSVSPGYSGTVFEPIDAFKGDIARMILYFVTRYESQLSGFGTGNMLGGSAFPGLQTWELNQLLAWHMQILFLLLKLQETTLLTIIRETEIHLSIILNTLLRSGELQLLIQAPTAPTNLRPAILLQHDFFKLDGFYR
jgi:hypothetical protein